jgi:hypothetical protein
MIESRAMLRMYPLLSLCYLIIEKPLESFGVICHKKCRRMEDNKDRSSSAKLLMWSKSHVIHMLWFFL